MIRTGQRSTEQTKNFKRLTGNHKTSGVPRSLFLELLLSSFTATRSFLARAGFSAHDMGLEFHKISANELMELINENEAFEYCFARSFSPHSRTYFVSSARLKKGLLTSKQRTLHARAHTGRRGNKSPHKSK